MSLIFTRTTSPIESTRRCARLWLTWVSSRRRAICSRLIPNEYEQIFTWSFAWGKLSNYLQLLGLEKFFFQEYYRWPFFLKKSTFLRFLKNYQYDFDQTWHVASYSYGGHGGTYAAPTLFESWPAPAAMFLKTLTLLIICFQPYWRNLQS